MSELSDRTRELAALHTEVFGAPKTSQGGNGHAPVSNLDVAEIIANASGARNGGKFRALFNGDTTGYPSQSEADLALASEIAFWAGPGEESLLVKVGSAYEAATHHRKAPAAFGPLAGEP